jgi:hypothetical protein
MGPGASRCFKIQKGGGSKDLRDVWKRKRREKMHALDDAFFLDVSLSGHPSS